MLSHGGVACLLRLELTRIPDWLFLQMGHVTRQVLMWDYVAVICLHRRGQRMRARHTGSPFLSGVICIVTSIKQRVELNQSRLMAATHWPTLFSIYPELRPNSELCVVWKRLFFNNTLLLRQHRLMTDRFFS